MLNRRARRRVLRPGVPSSGSESERPLDHKFERFIMARNILLSLLHFLTLVVVHTACTICETV